MKNNQAIQRCLSRLFWRVCQRTTGSKLTFSSNLFHNNLLAPTELRSRTTQYTGPDVLSFFGFHF